MIYTLYSTFFYLKDRIKNKIEIMSTKTVKLNAALHETLKGIADKEGFVLQDLIEEKLTEILEEKGVYNFNPSEITFVPEKQLFNFSLKPEHLQALIVMFKRLCLNEKINNLTQMNNLLETIKKLEGVYDDNKKDIEINEFFKQSQQTIAKLLTEAVEKESDLDEDEKLWEQYKVSKTSKNWNTANIYNANNSTNTHNVNEVLRMFEEKSYYYAKLGETIKKTIIESEGE